MAALLISSYLGSTGTDQANAITLDTVGNAYLLGQSTVSDGFPLEQPLQPTVNGLFDAFIMKIGHLTLPAVPICDIGMTQSIYQPGEQAIASVIRVLNPGPQPVPLELKIWRLFPDGTVVPYLNIGADGQQLIIPAESEQPYVPLPVLNVIDLTIKGRYEFNCRLLEPFTGKLIAEDRNPFDVQ